MNRRRMLRLSSRSVAAGTVAILAQKDEAIAQTFSKATRGLPALKITNPYELDGKQFDAAVNLL